jgi:D-arabinose 1-dehydrogenase-like Zn-dependent alcohol dehydrogenase
MARLFFRQVRLQGTTMGSPGEFAAMLEFLQKHKVVPVIDRVLPLGKAADACKLLEKSGQTGKIVFHNQPGG